MMLTKSLNSELEASVDTTVKQELHL